LALSLSTYAGRCSGSDCMLIKIDCQMNKFVVKSPIKLMLPLVMLHLTFDGIVTADEYCCPQHDHNHDEMWKAIYATQGWMILHMYQRGDLNVEATNEDGLTPLYYVARAGDPSMLDMFLDLGAFVEPVDPKKNITVLYDAVLRGNIQIVRMLLEAGASPDLLDHVPLSPLWYATKNGWYDMVKLLLEYKAPTTARDYRNYSPLSLAAIVNRIDLATLLLENGADASVLKEEVPNYKGKLSIISVCHKTGYPPQWLPENPNTGKCQEWQPGFVITLEAILKSHAFYDMVQLLEAYGGYPPSGRAIEYVGTGVDGSGTQGV